MSAGADDKEQKFELYIKASAIDKETKGSCPICQHWFMITCLLGENQDDIDFKVYTVQADCPPKNFGVDQGWSKRFPVVMVLKGRNKSGQDISGTKYDTSEELDAFFESINRDNPELKNKNMINQEAMEIVEGVYNAFNRFLSSGNDKPLMAELKKINSFLVSEDKKYLADDVLTYSDCFLLPRLQHIRIAGEHYRKFSIPADFTGIWRYLDEAYKTEAFRSTMPSDQDIVFHYEKKMGPPVRGPKGKGRPTLQNFTYALDIPEDIATAIYGSGGKTNGDKTNGDVSEQVEQVTSDLPYVDISPQHAVEPEVQSEVVADPEPQASAETVPEQETVAEPEPEQEAVAECEPEQERVAEPQQTALAESESEPQAATDLEAEEVYDEMTEAKGDAQVQEIAEANGSEDVGNGFAVDGGDASTTGNENGKTEEKGVE